MTIAETAQGAPPAAPRHIGLRIGLAALAALELRARSTSWRTINTPAGFVQALTGVYLALAPLVSGAALLLAAIGRVREAILALALVILLTWLLHGIWSIHGSGLPWASVDPMLQLFIFPAAAIAGAALAVKNRRLAIAGLLVSVPTICSWVPMVIFTLGVLIYGF
jgi:hypothetical protein